MKRSLLATVALVVGAAILAVGLVGARLMQTGPQDVAHAQGFEFAIDALPWNGATPCNPIDATNTVDVGDNHQVAVCTENEPRDAGGVDPDDVNVFTFFLNYDKTLNSCPDPDCQPLADPPLPDSKCLDDNPDVNARNTFGIGHVPTTPNLGSGWDCAGLGSGIQPYCTDGQAKADCLSAAGPWTSGGLSPFPLAIVNFTAIDDGTDTLITSGNVWSGVFAGEQVPVSVSADVIKEPPPPATATPTPTITPIPTNTPTVTPTPETSDVWMLKDCDTSTEYDGDLTDIDTECNLWLMADGCKDDDQAKEGKGCLVIDKWVLGARDTDSPNDTDDDDEGVGAWEEQIKYDHKIVRLNAEPDNEWLEKNGRVAICTMTILTENWSLTGCVTKDVDLCANAVDDDYEGGWVNDGCPTVPVAGPAETTAQCNNGLDDDSDGVVDDGCPEYGAWCADALDNDSDGKINDGCPQIGDTSEFAGSGHRGALAADGLIEKITVNPMTEDLIYRQGFRPTKDNGVVTDIVDENCEVADILGEPIPGTDPGGLAKKCGDVHITVRMLEGDTNLDCRVDVFDDQAIAFRYGSFFGLTLYDEWYDLAPECTTYACDANGDTELTDPDDVCTTCTVGVPDFDIDIKDLQFVFGRNYSTCQVPIPDGQADPIAPAQP